MPDNAIRDKKISDKIAQMLNTQQVDEHFLDMLSRRELLEEISVYHQELLYQNDELARRAQELEIARQLYQDLFNDAPVGYAVLDPDYRIMTANRTLAALLATEVPALLGKPLSSLVHPASQDSLYLALRELERSGACEMIELQLAGNFGDLFVHFRSNVYYQEDKRLIRSTFIDLTSKKQIEYALRATESRYRLITENSSDVIFTLNLTQRRFTYLSPSISKLSGFGVAEAQQQDISSFVTTESLEYMRGQFAEGTREILSDPAATVRRTIEIQSLNRSGETVWIELTVRFTLNADRDVELIGVARNIDERKRAESRIVYLSYHDQLTGAGNRHLYQEQVGEEIRRSIRFGTPLALAAFDIDEFKVINDRFGHPIGDLILQELTFIARRCMRPTDQLFRMGGEEFLILMPNTGLPEATALMEQFRQVLAGNRHDKVGVFTCSFGVAARLPGESADSWLTRADDAMYRAKRKGRNRVEAASGPVSLPGDDTLSPGQNILESGNKQLDREHNELLALADQLMRLNLQQDNPQLQSQLEVLLDHAIEHFQHEESILAQAAYPDLDLHIQQHQMLLSQAGQLMADCRQGRLDPQQTVSFLIGQLVSGHMLESDILFIPLLRRTSGRTADDPSPDPA